MHDPRCIFCGARLVQNLRTVKRPAAEIAKRQRAVIAGWIAAGHAENDLMALVAGPLAIAPEVAVEPVKPKRKGK
jgi:hypothetical protein